MEENKYLKEIERLESEFKELKDKSNQDGQDFAIICALLRHLTLLKKLIVVGFANSIGDDLIESDIEYFQKNVNGLKLALDHRRR